MGLIGSLQCALRSWHDPQRQPIGGFKCRTCGKAGADLHDLGFIHGGYVHPLRRLFKRDRFGGSVERTAHWEKEGGQQR